MGDSLYWWDADQDPHVKVWEICKTLWEQHAHVRAGMRDNLSRYLNRIVPDLVSDQYWDQKPANSSTNLCGSVVDTLCSRVGTQKTRVQFLTSGATYSERRKNKRRSLFSFGLQATVGQHAVNRAAFRDALIMSRGFTVPEVDEATDTTPASITATRVLPFEILVDQLDAKNGKPSHMYRVKSMSRSVLIDLYPDFEDAIKEAEILRRDDGRDRKRDLDVDVVTVIEAWRLPTRKGSGNGRHVLALSSATLQDGVYDGMEFPIKSLSCSDPTLGYWAPSIVEGLANVQDDIDALEGKERRQAEQGSYNVYITPGSKVKARNITNTDGQCIEVEGAEIPRHESVNAINPALGPLIERKIQNAYRICGISQFMAQNQKPSGLDSAPAQREFHDNEELRISDILQRYDEFQVEVVLGLFESVKSIGEGYEVLVNKGRSGEKIKFSDIDLPEGEFIAQPYLANFLPTTPSARTQKIVEMMQDGTISQAAGVALSDDPDLEAAFEELTAPTREVENAIELMLEHGKTVMPSIYTDLSIAGPKVHRAILEAQLSGEREDRIQLMMNYLSACEELMKQAAPPPPPTPSSQPIASYVPGQAAPSMPAPAPAAMPAPMRGANA
jgi:hypothetical protein